MYYSDIDPAFQILVLQDVVVEPVTVSNVKQFSHIDQDYAANDEMIKLMITAAREKLEGLSNLFFAQKKVQVQFYGAALQLPNGPTGEIVSVTKNNDADPLAADKYSIRGLNYKTIILKDSFLGDNAFFYPVWGGAPIPWVWTANTIDFYNVIYFTGYEIGKLPGVLKTALLMLVDYFLKEQGTTNLEVPPAIAQLANSFSRNLVIQ